MAFAELGIQIEFRGNGIDEKGYIINCTNPAFQLTAGNQVVSIDAAYFRPTEVELLIGDPTKAKQKLGWEPKYDLAALVKEMVAADLEDAQKI